MDIPISKSGQETTVYRLRLEGYRQNLNVGWGSHTWPLGPCDGMIEGPKGKKVIQKSYVYLYSSPTNFRDLPYWSKEFSTCSSTDRGASQGRVLEYRRAMRRTRFRKIILSALERMDLWGWEERQAAQLRDSCNSLNKKWWSNCHGDGKRNIGK